jgi:hypothetical protein
MYSFGYIFVRYKYLHETHMTHKPGIIPTYTVRLRESVISEKLLYYIFIPAGVIDFALTGRKLNLVDYTNQPAGKQYLD